MSNPELGNNPEAGKAPEPITEMPKFEAGTPAPEPPKFEYTPEQQAEMARKAVESADINAPGAAVQKFREGTPPELRRQPGVDLTIGQENAQRDAYYGARQADATTSQPAKRGWLDRLLGRK